MTSAEIAEASVRALATVIAPSATIDPVLVARLGGLLAGVLLGDPWADAEKAGVERAMRIKTVQDAEAAARSRT